MRKIVLIFFFTLLLGVTAEAQTQVVSIPRETASLSEIFEQVEAQTGLSVDYDTKVINASQRVSVPAGPSDVKGLFDSIFKALGYTYTFNGNHIIINEKQKPSEKSAIAGTIVDEQGSPVIGAGILVQNSKIGTISDIDGKFILDVPVGSTVTVSAIGYVSQKIVLASNDVAVVLVEDKLTLEETVVVGYGTQKKATLTGSVASIKGETMLDSKAANISSALAGRVAGLTVNSRGGNPGEDQNSIVIRGIATTGNNSPLYVIDGIANRGGFERLSPDDIESISVLKDASASIYGAQAANGVILITTKRGKEGKPSIQYSNEFSLSQPTRRPTLMNSQQYLTWIDEQNERNGRPTEYQDVIRAYKKGTVDTDKWGDTDWWSVVMNKWSLQHQHFVGLSGGSEQFKYYLSGQFLDQDAIYKAKAYGYKQYNLRANIDAKITNNFKVGVDISYRVGDILSPTMGQSDLFRQVFVQRPVDVPYFSNGLLAKTANGNPVSFTNGDSGEKRTQNKRLETKASFRWDLPFITKGLYIQGHVAYDYYTTYKKEFYTPYDIYYYNSSTGEYTNDRDQTGTISLNQSFYHDRNVTYNAMIGYERIFGDHNISGFIAYEQSQEYNESFRAYRKELVSTELPYLFTGSDDGKDNGGSGFETARMNFFGRINYNFRDKYLAEFTLRYDGSANFMTGKRFGLFPGVSLGWRISEEDFLKQTPVNNLKIRASWGKLGNDRVANFQYLQFYNLESSATFGETMSRSIGLTPGTTPNPDITWETAQKYNLGVDFDIWKSLLGGSIDVFYQRRSDILAPRNASVPTYTGISLPDENIGKTSNQGVELQLYHYNTVGDVSYSVSGQVSYATSKIIFIDEALNTPEWQKRTGRPIDYIKVYEADGLFQSQEQIQSVAHFADAKPGDVKFVDQNNDGVINSDDQIILTESNTPKLTYGLSLGVEWKGIALTALFQGQGMAKCIYRPWDLNQQAEYFEGRWVSARTTPNAAYPAAYDMSSSSIQYTSTIWVKDCDFLRLKNLELSYTFPKTLLSKLRIQDLKINISGNNLFFIYDKVKMLDPETTTATGWYYPQQRLISAGLKITF